MQNEHFPINTIKFQHHHQQCLQDLNNFLRGLKQIQFRVSLINTLPKFKKVIGPINIGSLKKKFVMIKTIQLHLSKLKGIVGAVVIFDHGLKFGIIFLVSDHPAHEKLIASKKNFITIE